MSQSTIAIVGSGIVGTVIAHWLSRQGHDVVVFEKGNDYAYPHSEQFRELILNRWVNPAHEPPPDIKNHTLTGGYRRNLEGERSMRTGGSATHWNAITPRMIPEDFRTHSQFGYGDDWPLSYSDLEPYYSEAETFLGVSGTDSDNPFAPPRSKPYPLPPFELSYHGEILRKRLQHAGIALHTTPQARARQAFSGRPGCQNFGACKVCPIGARYSPTFHLIQAVATGRCQLLTNTSVRRIQLNRAGEATSLVYQENDSNRTKEHPARIIVVAGGALESARLLLLSTDGRHPDGLGNQGGHVGRNLTFHSLWTSRLRYNDPVYPGRFGGITGQSHQFLNAPTRGRHASVKVEFSENRYNAAGVDGARSGSDILERSRKFVHWRDLTIHAESVAGPSKCVFLSETTDRFGDPFAHIHYDLDEFDAETFAFGERIVDRFREATGAGEIRRDPIEAYDSGAHHMGTCRMGTGPHDSVVDSFGRVHGIPNLFVLGGSCFVGSSGAVNPTLTMAALAIRSASYVMDQLLS